MKRHPSFSPKSGLQDMTTGTCVSISEEGQSTFVITTEGGLQVCANSSEYLDHFHVLHLGAILVECTLGIQALVSWSGSGWLPPDRNI